MKARDFTMRLCGHDVSVKHTDPGNWATTGMGRSNSITGEIELSTKLTDATRPATFLHELLHLLLDFNGQGAISVQETVIDNIAVSLLAWMRDNKGLVVELAAGPEKKQEGYPIGQ